ncbi:Retsat [Symbiodinium necroappetens]|uniref:Retsat protein n=1 Tax=Symbiodinium necroappetens TaxID=1628268 RepID=A0A812RJK7_9DINO|nr:Retsat [Symbiodinium necroappetens]
MLLSSVFWAGSRIRSLRDRLGLLRTWSFPGHVCHPLVQARSRTLRVVSRQHLRQSPKLHLDRRHHPRGRLLGRRGESKKGYDVVVIGAGLGGLACAAALGKAGRRVLVLEAHSVLGGCAHSFKRKAPGGGEYLFDSGPSILTDMGKRNPLRVVMDYVGASQDVEWIYYDGWGMLTPEGPWRLQLGTSNFRDTVLPRYGVPPEEFDEVLKASAPLAQIGRQIPGLVLRDDEWQLLPLLLKFPGAVLPAIREAASLSEPYSKVLDQLEAEGKMRKGSWLRAWLDALAFSLSGLDCSGTTTAAMAFTVDELHWEGTRGLAYPKGGMGSVIDALAAAVRREGGEIRTNVRVEEVLMDNRCAVGVRCLRLRSPANSLPKVRLRKPKHRRLSSTFT